MFFDSPHMSKGLKMKNEGKLSRKTNHFGSTIILLPILFSLGGLTFDLAKINSKELEKNWF